MCGSDLVVRRESGASACRCLESTNIEASATSTVARAGFGHRSTYSSGGWPDEEGTVRRPATAAAWPHGRDGILRASTIAQPLTGFFQQQGVSMRVAIISALLVTFAAPVPAQVRSADEKAIRDLIDKINTGRAGEIGQTEDSVFWSGAIVRPIVGDEKAEIRPGSSAGDKRANIKSIVTVKQLKVSQSSDMAYEYSTTRNSWDRTDNKKHIEFDAASLRVWQKVNGNWKIAAFFQRPIEDTPSER
jgi:ketosteroid isomerase-like protein